MMKRKITRNLALILLVTVSLSIPGIPGDGLHSSEKISKSTNIGIDTESCNPFFSDVLVRINVTNKSLDLPTNVETVGSRPGEWVDIIMPMHRLHELSDAHINYSVLIRDVDSYSQSVAGKYHTLAEMEEILQDIANNYPNITRLYSIGKTYEGRDIWCLEISDNPGVDEGEPGVFYMGLHHAREWPSLEICLYISEKLTSGYNVDPNITNVVNNRRLWIVPCVNPDGYYFSHDYIIQHDWRKNRHYFPEFGTYGVDINRNYCGSSNGDAWGSWGSVGHASVTHNSSYETYCGPSPMSENETQAIRNVFLNNNICASISWHTYSEYVMWPWSYSKSKQTPDDAYMSYVGKQIASRITKQGGSGTYTPMQSSNLYPTTGDTTDWAYGYGHYIQGRPTFAYTIEACNQFHPIADSLDQICAENFDGALYLLQEADNISKVTPRVLPPVIDKMYDDPDGNFTVSWMEQNPSAKPDHFQLDEMTDLSFKTDDAESDSDLWNLDGFSITDSRYCSSSHCFKPRNINNDVSSMTSVYPIPVKNGMTLSFHCWFDIENNWDYAFVEISKDGRCYNLLDKFTGSSGGWVFKNYALDEYAGESVFIRFRYTTDDNTLGGGFYIDDISPIADFSSIVPLSDSISGDSYNVTWKSEGDYYYRVRGYNLEHGWGDFSVLKKIHVGLVNNEPPNKPTINGIIHGKAGKSYTYTFFSYDPDGDDVYYYINWGDNISSDWVGPYRSNKEVMLNHTFLEKGTYVIQIKAKDIHDAESNWTTLEVSMPRNKQLTNLLYPFQLLEKIIYFIWYNL